MIPIAICDDELLHARQTQAAIRRCEAQAVTRCFETPLALLAAVTQQGYAPRVAVLDIRMAGMDGIELAKRLNALVPGCAIIFLTAYLSYAPDVYETRHVYFVLKSELDRRIGSALRAALAETAAPASLQLATAHGYRNVPARPGRHGMDQNWLSDHSTSMSGLLNSPNSSSLLGISSGRGRATQVVFM